MAEANLDLFKEDQAKEAKADIGRKVRVGIIGCGWIADEHIRIYKDMEDVEIVAGADLIPGKAKAFFDKWEVTGVKCDYPSHKEMLDDESLRLDAVSVCTYNRQHAAPTIYALKKGVNVVLEKPMCVTLDEAVEICRAEKESGKILSLGFQPRFDENMKMLKKIVQSGELGKIYYVQTGGGRRKGIPTPFGTTFIEDATAGIGAMGDIGCYSLDMVLNSLGYPKPLTVSGYTSNYFGIRPDRYPKHPEYAKKFEVEDFAAGFIRLEGGIVLDFRIAWDMNLDTPGDTIFMGTKGSVRVPSTECWNGSIGGPMIVYHDIAGKSVQTEIPMLKNKVSNFRQKMVSFIEAVKTGGKAPIPSSEIIINQAIIDGIVKSAKLGREIEINIPKI